MLGLGGSSAMAAANTLIPDLYPENPSSALNLGGIFFGVGAVFFPWLVALMTHRLGLVSTLWFIALLVGGVAVVAMAQTFPPASMAGGFDWEQAMSLATNPAVIILGCVLFFYSSLEISTAGWIRTFLEKDLAASPESSKFILSLRAGIWMLAGIAVLFLVTQGIFNRYERRKLLAPATGPA
jgi:fucose permease